MVQIVHGLIVLRITLLKNSEVKTANLVEVIAGGVIYYNTLHSLCLFYFCKCIFCTFDSDS